MCVCLYHVMAVKWEALLVHCISTYVGSFPFREAARNMHSLCTPFPTAVIFRLA